MLQLTSWLGTTSYTYNSDGDYNTGLRDAITRSCNIKAQNVTKGLSFARYTGSIEIKGSRYQPGTLMRITNPNTGQPDGDTSLGNTRIQAVRHNVTKNGWITTLDLAQDILAIAPIIQVQN